MKNLISIISICLYFTSFQSIANRPAENESSVIFEKQIVDATSSIAAPEADSADHETVIASQPTEEEATAPMPMGDVINVEQTQDRSQLIIINFPIRGMDMSKVLNELGEPTKRFPAIGKPPITRWVYPDRTVFFEYSHVIHVVAK